MSKKDKFVNAIHHCKYKIISNKKSNSIMTPTKLLLQANLIQEDHKRNLKNFFIKHWELGNEISSNELNPKKKRKKETT